MSTITDPIRYGVTHCPHCERPYGPDAPDPARTDICHGSGFDMSCSQLAYEDRMAHLIAALQERDFLRAELTLFHEGQLSLLALTGGAA